MELWDKAERLWTRVKNWKTVRGWHIWKLKLVDARSEEHTSELQSH